MGLQFPRLTVVPKSQNEQHITLDCGASDFRLVFFPSQEHNVTYTKPLIVQNIPLPCDAVKGFFSLVPSVLSPNITGFEAHGHRLSDHAVQSSQNVPPEHR